MVWYNGNINILEMKFLLHTQAKKICKYKQTE